MKNTLIILFSLFSQLLFAQWSNGKIAEHVIGQPNFSTYNSGTFTAPQNVAIDYLHNKMYVTDIVNDAVYRFAYPVSSDNPSVEVTFGVSGSPAASQNQFSQPYGIAVHNGALWVSDQSNNRILKFSSAYSVSSNSPNADLVLGQSNYTNSGSSTTQSTFSFPAGIYIDANDNLWVADYANNRVLEFIGADTLTNGAKASLVFGQSDFISSTSGTSSTTFNNPQAVAVYGTNVWVDDYNNNRVLRFDNPAVDGQAASAVLGQADFNSAVTGASVADNNFNYPTDIDIDAAGRLYVSDEGDARILIFNNASAKANNGTADYVIGQFNFTTLTDTNGGQYHFYNDSSPLHNVEGITVDTVNNKLLAVDQDNQRVLQFAASSALPVELTTFAAASTGSATGSPTIELQWNTATEVNNYGFEIERKVVSKEYGVGNNLSLVNRHSSFTEIGFVKGSGNSNSPKNYSFIDDNPPSGEIEYRLEQIDNNGNFKYSQIVTVTFLPTNFELWQNYPNPFNPTTTIRYTIPKTAHVTLKIYDEIGREVTTLINGNKEAGQYNVTFNASKLASGVYFYRLRAGSFDGVKKLILLK